jgi:beta-lactamase class A
MATSSRSLRSSRLRSSRSDRKNRFQVVPNAPELGQIQGSEKSSQELNRGSGREPGKSRGRSKRLPLPVLYGIRLLILGVGLGVIAGTLLAAIDPDYQVAGETPDPNGTDPGLVQGEKKVLPVAARNTLVLKSEMTELTQQLQALANEQPDLVAGAFVVDLDTGNYAQLNGQRSFATASMIKVHILVGFFQEVDAGNIDLAEQLTMRQDLVAPHAGDMQYLPVGTQFSALETAEEMIRISDNTATNMLIDRLGGIAAVNQRFKEWGLKQTVLNEWLPDLEGTNVSSPQDLVTLMSMVEQGQLVSIRSRDRLLAILRTPITNTLLPQGLGEGATIAHKTGDIGTLVGDVGLIDMPNGKRYLAAMMVERPFNDNRAQELIRQMSRASYDYLEKLPVSETPQNRETPAGILTQQGQVVSPASLPVNISTPGQ